MFVRASQGNASTEEIEEKLIMIEVKRVMDTSYSIGVSSDFERGERN